MMIFRKTIPYILCWCFCFTLAAQTFKIDSLEQVLASGKLKNSEKAELLKNLSNAYHNVDTAKCRIYALEAIRLAHSISLKKVEAAAYIALANYYGISADTAKQRTYLQEALRLAQTNNGLELEEGVAYINLGNAYLSTNQYYLSHVHYKKAEKLLLKLDDKERLSLLYNNLLFLFAIINDDDNAIYYANKLLEIAVELGNQTMKLFAQFMLVYTRYKDNYEEALDYLLDIYQKSILLNSNYTPIITLNCGIVYIQLNRLREALQNLHWAREYYETHESDLTSRTYTHLAEAYAMLHRADSAQYYLKKATEASIIDDETRTIQHRIRSLLDANKGDYRSALESFKKYHHLSDSIAKAGKSADIARMKNWYELEQKDNENQILQQEQQKQHRLIMILAGALVMILTLLTLSVSLYRKTVEKNRELKKLHTVKDKLFSVVAHDLRSPVGALISVLKSARNNTLDSETQAQLLKDISTQVDDTYGLLDNLLQWSKSQMQRIIPAPAYFDVQAEIQTVMDSLQHIAATKMITLHNHIGQHQVYADRDMFAVVVRNLVTNAIKYTSTNGEVTIASELSGNMLIISVKDAGTGMSQEIQNKLFKLSEIKSQRGTNNESGTGLGLVLCADFAKINGGSIWFTSTLGEGSTFFFSIPVKGN